MSARDVSFEPYVVSAPTPIDQRRNRDRTISRQIDELVRISKTQRDKELGAEWSREVRDLYNVDTEPSSYPSFQPRMSIPQMQSLILNEATDITDATPIPYITLGDGRDKERERYFQANWAAGFYNNRLLEASLWSLYTNMGYLQVGFDPLARRGRGNTWVESRNPAMTFVDPYCSRDDLASWWVLEDWRYIDWVRWKFPAGYLVKPHYVSETEPGSIADVSLEYPEYSPLSTTGTAPMQRIFRDNRVRVRTLFCLDSARERIKDYAGSHNMAADLVSEPRWEFKYPDGRWIIESEGIILADSNNWCPKLPDDERNTWPLVRIQGTPALHNVYGPAPMRFTKTLQALSERLYSQLFENCARLNNGVIVIKSNTGLVASDIGWMPGEILTIHPQADVPQVITPPAFPPQFFQAPQVLLALQKELMGYGQTRQGEIQPGNISADLFDATLWQSQGLTRMRTRLLAEPLQRLAQLVFYIEARYRITSDKRVDQSAKTFGFTTWEPTSRWFDYDIELDKGSLKMLSAAGLRTVVAALSKANMLPTETVLESFGVPHSQEIAEEKMRELELSAVSRLKRPR